MLKSCFILLFSVLSFYGNDEIQKGDEYFSKKEYIKSIELYEKGFSYDNSSINKEKLLTAYITLADRFFLLYKYRDAEIYYQKGIDLGSILAQKRLGVLYEKQAQLYHRGHKYEEALQHYKDSYALGNEKVAEKIESIEAFLNHQKNIINDTRKIVTQNSPSWTQAIGKIIVPTKSYLENNSAKTKVKKCSATLVNFDETQSSRVIVTASHCLTQFDKKAGTIRFIIKSKSGKTIQKYATVYVDSNFDVQQLQKHSDYAILILSSKIPTKEVTPIAIDRRSFSKLQKEYQYGYGSLAGFSSDVGEFGTQLTYDPKCTLKEYSENYGKSDCSGFKGASGGPVVLTLSNDKKNIKYFFVGVVSHFIDNRYQEIYFAPHHLFFQEVEKAILKFNQ